MKDINFFEPYISWRKPKINPYLSLNLLLGLILIILIIHIGFNRKILKEIYADIYDMESKIKINNVFERIELIEKKEEELTLSKDRLNQLMDFQNIIDNNYSMDIDIISSIVSKMPNGIFLKSIEFYQGEIYLQGISQEQISIVEFIGKLEDMEEIGMAFLSNIIHEEMEYKFNITISPKEVFVGEED